VIQNLKIVLSLC